MTTQNARRGAVLATALAAGSAGLLLFNVHTSNASLAPTSASATVSPSGTTTSSAAAGTPSATTTAPVPVTVKPCNITGIVFYHKDATGDDFGPKPVISDSASVWKHFQDEFCPSEGASDPSLDAAIIAAHARAVATHTGGVDSTAAAQAQATATAWVNNKDTTDWISKVTAFMKTVATYEVKPDGAPYSTFNMHGKDGQPTLTFTDKVNHAAGLIVVIHFNDRTPDMTLRVDCDMQPMTDIPSTPAPGPTTAPTTGPTGTLPPPCNCNTTPPPCGSACTTTPPSHSTTPPCSSCHTTTPPTTKPTTPPTHTTTPPPPAPVPPKILGYTRLNDVDAGGTSPNYCVTSLWVPNGDSYTLSFDAAYGHTTGSGKCVTYVAPYDAGTGSDTITITLIDNKTGLSASVTDTFTVNPIPSRP